MHPASLPTDDLMAACEVQRTRRSGPGGQHRNKVETAVVLTHKPTGMQAEASERRSQAENLAMAAFRLRVNLALGVRSTERTDSASALWDSRCRDGKLAINATHDDFPAILAEALDVVSARRLDFPAACEVLGCTSSQLVKLLEKEPRALATVNQARQSAGLKPMR